MSDKLLDLRKCNYSGKNLSGKTLAGALLSETDMSNTNLTEAVLTKVGRGAGAARQLQQGVGRSCSRGWVAAGDGIGHVKEMDDGECGCSVRRLAWALAAKAAAAVAAASLAVVCVVHGLHERLAAATADKLCKGRVMLRGSQLQQCHAQPGLPLLVRRCQPGLTCQCTCMLTVPLPAALLPAGPAPAAAVNVVCSRTAWARSCLAPT